MRNLNGVVEMAPIRVAFGVFSGLPVPAGDLLASRNTPATEAGEL